MKTTRKFIVRTLLEIGFVIVLHQILLIWLAKKDVVATILSAGDHVPISYLMLAVLFVIVRLFTLVLLPGFVLQRLVWLGFHLLNEARPETEQNQNKPQTP